MPDLQVGKLLWSLELLQQYENFFGIIVLQFVSHLLSCSMVGLMATSPKKTYSTHCASQVCCSQRPCPQAPGRCLRDRLARAPGHRHTWGHKAGREGTGLCAASSASGLRGARGPQTSPSGQGHNGAGAQHRSPDGRVGEPHVHRARLRGYRISNWAGGKIPPYIRC